MYIIIFLIKYLQHKSNTFLDFINDDSLKSNYYKNKVNELEKKVNTLENNIKEMEIKLKEKERIINEEKIKNEKPKIEIEKELENKFNNKILELENEINKLKVYFISPGEKLITIKFISVDQTINFSTYAKINDNFSKIENILYNNYPNYKETENYFLANGNIINKYKTLEENKIKNNDVLTLNKIDD